MSNRDPIRLGCGCIASVNERGVQIRRALTAVDDEIVTQIDWETLAHLYALAPSVAGQH